MSCLTFLGIFVPASQTYGGLPSIVYLDHYGSSPILYASSPAHILYSPKASTKIAARICRIVPTFTLHFLQFFLHLQIHACTPPPSMNSCAMPHPCLMSCAMLHPTCACTANSTVLFTKNH